MSKLILGIIYGLLAQILTFLQLQGNIKYDWFHKYPILLLSLSIPISYLYIRSVENLVLFYNGEIWPSRLIGFSLGIIVFAVLSYVLFKEIATLKTIICLLLSIFIILIQILWK
jgi:hypothetical protein